MGDRGWGDVRRPEAEGALGSSIRGLGSERFLPEEAEPGRVARRQGQRRSVFQAVVDPLPCVLRASKICKTSGFCHGCCSHAEGGGTGWAGGGPTGGLFCGW